LISKQKLKLDFFPDRFTQWNKKVFGVLDFNVLVNITVLILLAIKDFYFLLKLKYKICRNT